MQLEVIRAVSDALRSPLYGVNTKLLTLPRYIDGTAPEAITLLADESNDECVTRRQPPVKTPALYVVAEEPFELDSEMLSTPQNDLSNFAIAVRYFAADTKVPRVTTATLHALRACAHSLSHWFYAGPASEKTRNGIHFVAMPRVFYGLWREDVGGSVVTGALVAYLQVRDLNL